MNNVLKYSTFTTHCLNGNNNNFVVFTLQPSIANSRESPDVDDLEKFVFE